MSETASDTALAGVLRSARSVVVCGHVTPDGDAIGATVALTLALRAAGVDATPTLADDHAAPETYAFLEGAELFRPASGLVAPELFVALDTPNWARLGVAAPLARAAGRVAVIDHHVDNQEFGALHLVDTAAASTGSIVWRLLPLLGVRPTPAMAAACYTALMTDTGRFSYGNTSARALRDAADMIEAGADSFDLYTRIYESRSSCALALLGRVLARITLTGEGRIAYSWMTDADLLETGARAEDTENIVDVVRQVEGVRAVALFKEQADCTKVSLRAKVPGLDVGAVARAFGGGGHAAAAGATLDARLADAQRLVLERLQDGAA